MIFTEHFHWPFCMFVGIFVVFKFLLFVGFGGCFSIFQHVSAFQQERIDKYGIPPLIVRLIALFIHSFVYINFFCYLVFSTNIFVVFIFFMSRLQCTFPHHHASGRLISFVKYFIPFLHFITLYNVNDCLILN